MSVESAIDKISLDLHKVGLSPLRTTPDKKPPKPKSQPIAESWEDEASDTDEDENTKSPISDSAYEAPGPTHLKSPTTRAVDAARELEGDIHNLPEVPPPTPISPSLHAIKPDWSPARSFGGNRPPHPAGSDTSSPRSTPRAQSINPTPRHGTPEPNREPDRDRDRERDRRRPEKTTATANRLIAGALGIKAPPKTEEQRKYERAMKEQEIRRRNKEKEEKKKEAEEDEKLKTAIWDS